MCGIPPEYPQMDSFKKLAKNMSRQISTNSGKHDDPDVEASQKLQTNQYRPSNDPMLQRLTSVEERNHRRKMRQIFQSVRNLFFFSFVFL